MSIAQLDSDIDLIITNQLHSHKSAAVYKILFPLFVIHCEKDVIVTVK